jgi:hypothetical protein
MRPLLVIALLALALSSAAAQQTVPQSKVDELKQGSGSTDLKSHQQNNRQTPQGPSGPPQYNNRRSTSFKSARTNATWNAGCP